MKDAAAQPRTATPTPEGRPAPRPLLAWLQLFRIPNLFTALADIVAGYAFVRGALAPLPVFLLLLSASAMLYTAGMVLNDVYDLEQDLRERPHRPLPSGRIRRRAAAWCGYALLLAGWGLACLAGYLVIGRDAAAIAWRSGTVAALLVVCIVAYDAVMKRTPLGPLFMGGCRFFNLLLGMSTAGQIACGGSPLALRYEMGQLLIAGGIGIYIAGVTWFARTEARESSRLQLGFALCVMLSGLGMVAAYGSYGTRIEHFSGGDPKMAVMWQMLIALLGFTIARRAAMAIFSPSPERVQAAVKNAIISLIFLDAAVCLAVSPVYAIGVMALLLPTLLLGKWVYST